MSRESPTGGGRSVTATASGKYWLGVTVVCAVLAWMFIGRAVLNHAGVFSLVVGALAAVGALASVRQAVTRPAIFSFDEHGFSASRSKRFVLWDDVAEIRVARYQNDHNLVLKIKSDRRPGSRAVITTNATNPDEVEVNLDHNSLGWREVLSSVEAASGMTVQAFVDGPLRLRSQPDTHP